MKRILFIMLTGLLFVQCHNSPKPERRFVLKKTIAAIVDSFTSVNPGKKIYELYIDKKKPDSTVLLLFGGEASLTEPENIYYGQKSILQIVSNGVLVNIYSGTERYIRKGSEVPIFSQKEKHFYSLDFPKNGTYWVIWDKKGSSIILKERSEGYPFSLISPPVSSIRYTPPIIKKKGISNE